MGANRGKGFGEMQFHDHGLVISGTDFFDLMTQQMCGTHRLAKGEGDESYEKAIKELFDSVGKEKAPIAKAVDEAVGMLAAETEIQSYKNGFADAVCMILQAAMHRD